MTARDTVRRLETEGPSWSVLLAGLRHPRRFLRELVTRVMQDRTLTVAAAMSYYATSRSPVSRASCRRTTAQHITPITVANTGPARHPRTIIIARSSPEDRGSRTLALELDLVRKQDDPLTAVEVHGEQLASEVLGAVRPASPPLRAERFHPGTRSGALTGNVSLERLTWLFSFSDSGARHRRQIEP